jgi:hypothetical protein
MEITEVSLEKAFEIQRGETRFNMKELRGAIKAFYIELGFPEKEASLPKGETAGSWMDKLAACIHDKKQSNETLLFLKGQ